MNNSVKLRPHLQPKRRDKHAARVTTRTCIELVYKIFNIFQVPPSLTT